MIVVKSLGCQAMSYQPAGTDQRLNLGTRTSQEVFFFCISKLGAVTSLRIFDCLSQAKSSHKTGVGFCSPNGGLGRGSSTHS